MDAACTDGSCGNPPVLSGESNDDCCDGTPAHPALLSAHCIVGVEAGGPATRRMHKRALEDGAISALLELNNTTLTDIAEAMVGCNRKLNGSPPRRGSPAHCDGSGFSPVHGGHGGGEAYSALARVPNSSSPAGVRHSKMKRSSNEPSSAAAVMAAARLLAPMSSGSMGMQHQAPMGIHMPPPMGSMQLPPMGQAAMQAAAAAQQQYMQQQYAQQQYMQGLYSYPWMPMVMPSAPQYAMLPHAPATASAPPAPATAPPIATAQPVAAASATAPAAPAGTSRAPRAANGSAAAAGIAAPHATGVSAAVVVDPVPKRAAESWSVQQVADWMRSIHCEDMVAVVTAQEMDGLSLKAMYRTGSSGLGVLHGLLRSEFPAAKSGQRLRLVEGLVSLFTLPSSDSGLAV